MSKIFCVRGHNLLKGGCQTAFFLFKLGIKHAKQNLAHDRRSWLSKAKCKLSLQRVVFNEVWNLQLIFKTLSHLLPQPTLQLLQGLQHRRKSRLSQCLVKSNVMMSIDLILSRLSSSRWHNEASSLLKYEADS